MNEKWGDENRQCLVTHLGSGRGWTCGHISSAACPAPSGGSPPPRGCCWWWRSWIIGIRTIILHSFLQQMLHEKTASHGYEFPAICVHPQIFPFKSIISKQGTIKYLCYIPWDHKFYRNTIGLEMKTTANSLLVFQLDVGGQGGGEDSEEEQRGQQHVDH